MNDASREVIQNLSKQLVEQDRRLTDAEETIHKLILCEPGDWRSRNRIYQEWEQRAEASSAKRTS